MAVRVNARLNPKVEAVRNNIRHGGRASPVFNPTHSTWSADLAMKKQQPVEITQEVPETPSEVDITVMNPFDNVTERRPTLGTAKTSEFNVLIPPSENAPQDDIEVQSLEIEEENPEQKKMTFTNPPRNLYRTITACVWALSLGFSDGSVGVLLNYIQLQYHISYSVASLLWLANSIGYITVALLASNIEARLGRRCLVVGCICSVVMYSLVLTGLHYPLIVLGFFFGGVGTGVCVSFFNVFVSSLEKSSTALGYFHGCYGLGASISPLVATAFVEAGVKWNFFYLILLGSMAVNAFNTYYAFAYGEDDIAEFEKENDPTYSKALTDETGALMKLALKNKITWFASLFVLFYQGGEVAIGGWITTYLREYRGHSNASIGYVASGYWFGLSFGRLGLTRVIHKAIGARRGNAILVVSAIAFILLTWLVPSLPIEIITITFAGIAIGPIYPLMITYVVLEGLLPRKIRVVSLTITTAFGSSGGAIFPFLVGLISQFAGTFVVLPLAIAMFSCTLCLWLLMPNTGYCKGLGRLEYLRRLF